MAKVKLTCSVCYQSTVADTEQVVEGESLVDWWMSRMECCSECFSHTCWAPVQGSVCFKDDGHTGPCFPWKPEYAETPEDAVPIIGLWTDNPRLATA
jgi:hypothetical protein